MAEKTKNFDKLNVEDNGFKDMVQIIQPSISWDDVDLAPAQLSKLKEICSQSRATTREAREPGSAKKHLIAFFKGPNKAQKTQSAEIIAKDLGLPLYKVDLSTVVSKYIGETEKNLSHLFDKAANKDWILFFDEADALFGKRTEIRDAHDRYANQEISYLLQRMEDYRGLALLATYESNNPEKIIVDRKYYVVEFPYPKKKPWDWIWRWFKKLKRQA